MELKRIDRRRRRTSARQRAQLVERFQSNGLTRIVFARRYGVGLSTLGKWLSEARAAPPRPSLVVFREVSLAGVASAPAIAWAMEVVSRDGLTVRCREALSVQDLASLLRGPAC
jgi:DNA-binding transcriptional regulator YiaG